MSAITPITLHQKELPATRSDPQCRIVQWKPWPFDNPSLIGHCDVAFAGGWVLHQVPVFRGRDGTLSVGTPSAPQIDASGQVKLREDGKRMYVALLSFEHKAARERWNRLILGALAAAGITDAQGDAP